jgi:phage/conjugal plasmid C-4 type zinc finger TraR family protein
MAGGWTRDGAVEEQIEASLRDALARMRAQARAAGAGRADCAACGEPIPPARRRAIPGVTLCVACQSARDRAPKAGPGMSRRAP